MHREHDELVDPVQAVHDPSQPGLLDVRLAVDRRDDVRARLVRHRKRRSGDRAEEPVGVGHHVAHDVDAAEHFLAEEVRARAVVGAEEEPGEAVGLDPVVLLRHREVAAPKTGLDVCRAGSTRPRLHARLPSVEFVSP